MLPRCGARPAPRAGLPEESYVQSCTLGVISAMCLVTVVYVSYWPPVRSVHPHRLALTGQPRSHAWVAMQVETKFLRLFREVAIGDRINGWRVCWIGGWDKCRVVFVVMVEKRISVKRSDRGVSDVTHRSRHWTARGPACGKSDRLYTSGAFHQCDGFRRTTSDGNSDGILFGLVIRSTPGDLVTRLRLVSLSSRGLTVDDSV